MVLPNPSYPSIRHPVFAAPRLVTGTGRPRDGKADGQRDKVGRYGWREEADGHGGARRSWQGNGANNAWEASMLWDEIWLNYAWTMHFVCVCLWNMMCFELCYAMLCGFQVNFIYVWWQFVKKLFEILIHMFVCVVKMRCWLEASVTYFYITYYNTRALLYIILKDTKCVGDVEPHSGDV
jgi:hypothetical protein